MRPGFAQPSVPVLLVTVARDTLQPPRTRAEMHGPTSTRYLHIDASVAEMFGVPQRKHIFYPAKEPFSGADPASLDQLDQALQSSAEFTTTMTCRAGGEQAAEVLLAAVPLTSPADHEWLADAGPPAHPPHAASPSVCTLPSSARALCYLPRTSLHLAS